MSTHNRELWLRIGPYLIQLLFIPLIVYAIDVTRTNDMRAIKEQVAAEYVSKEEFKDWVLSHEKWTQERSDAIRIEIRALADQIKRVLELLDRNAVFRTQ